MLVFGMEYLCKQSYVIKDNVFSGKDLTLRRMVWYSDMANGSIGLFFMLKNKTGNMRTTILQVEVEVVRTKITLACTECKQRNYNMTKEKKNHPDRMETKKYCRFCKRHTMHKETK